MTQAAACRSRAVLAAAFVLVLAQRTVHDDSPAQPSLNFGRDDGPDLAGYAVTHPVRRLAVKCHPASLRGFVASYAADVTQLGTTLAKTD